MTTAQQIITIAILALGVMATRFLPFILFPAGRPTPPFIHYLGQHLPSAVFGMLVIYCLKDLTLANPLNISVTLLAVVVTVVTYILSRSFLFSFAFGTISYIFLLHFFL